MEYRINVAFERIPLVWKDEDEAVLAYLDGPLKEWCEQALSLFSFVKWDRLTFTKKPGGPHMLTCYGWIERKSDPYKDFVLVNLVLDSREVVYGTSSSAERDPQLAEICARLSGIRAYGMKKCTRVEEVFSVPNMIRLHGGKAAKP